MKIQHIHFASIHSTNDWAKENLTKLPQDQLTLITANEQTAGRGRFDRSWASPAENNIYASFCFFLPSTRRDVGNIAQIMAISAAEMLRTNGMQPQLKWPNDILIDQKKIAGILTEAILCGEHFCIIVGIGINVNMSEKQLVQLGRPATSMKHELKREVDDGSVLQQLQKNFLGLLEIFINEGFAKFVDRYSELLSLHSGDPVQFSDFHKKWKGTFSKINSDGSLSLRLDSGENKTFYAGEIIVEGNAS